MKFSKRIWVIILLTIFVFRPGCGTVFTFFDDREGSKYGLIYSGVRFDFRAAFDDNYMQHIPPGKVFCMLDIPASLFSDTIALPITVIIESYKYFKQSNKNTSPYSDSADTEAE